MITRSVLLRCRVERAFELFTEHAGDWWPPERRHCKDPASTIHIEPEGRFYERASDGREVALGIVRAFEPPHRLLLDWFPGTGESEPTRVEITFQPQGEGALVTVRHGAGQALELRYRRSAPTFERAWTAVLAALQSHA